MNIENSSMPSPARRRRPASADAESRRSRATPFPILTPRERDVLNLVLEGFQNKIIAWDLGVSTRTVENHRASIMKKTACRSVQALVRLAIVSGQLEDCPPSARPSPKRLLAEAGAK